MPADVVTGSRTKRVHPRRGGTLAIVALAVAMIIAACADGEEAETEAVATDDSGEIEEGADTSDEAEEGADTSESGPEVITVAEGWDTEVNESLTGPLRLAHSRGAPYAAKIVMRELGIVEQKFPNMDVEWYDIFTTADMRDAMLAGELEFGICSTPAFLQSWERGVEWKALATTGGLDYRLMVAEDGPDSVSELVGTDIMLSPGPGTAQYDLTRLLLAAEGEDPSALDSNWVSLPHPDAYQAVTTGQLGGHFATAEFVLRLQDDGFKAIGQAGDVLEGIVGTCVTTLDSTVEERPEVAKAYADLIHESTEWINNNPEAYAQVMSDNSGGEVEPELFLQLVEEGLVEYRTTDAGFGEMADALTVLGEMNRSYQGPEDFHAFPESAGSNW